MLRSIDTKRVINTKSFTLEIDLFGGAVIDFHLRDHGLNPLSFQFSKDQMPENNKAGAVYQGHFLCLGRWGSPSEGEQNAGVPDHGQIANMMWEEGQYGGESFEMMASSALEGLSIHRTIHLDSVSAVYSVDELVRNINPLGRMYNMVQHPTISAPFLDMDVVVDCNAGRGFDFAFDNLTNISYSEWPAALNDKSGNLKKSSPNPYSSVFSFVVDPGKEFGWITAFSPSHQLMIGYLWRRSDYPWINHWIHWSNEKIVYRGMEFGTTGIHKPYPEMLNKNLLELLGEKTYSYLDAGESHSRAYISFLQPMDKGYRGVADIKYDNHTLSIKEKNTDAIIKVPVSLNF